MKTITIDEEKLNFLINYLKSRIKKNEWVLENKGDIRNEEYLEELNENLKEILEVLSKK